MPVPAMATSQSTSTSSFGDGGASGAVSSHKPWLSGSPFIACAPLLSRDLIGNRTRARRAAEAIDLPPVYDDCAPIPRSGNARQIKLGRVGKGRSASALRVVLMGRAGGALSDGQPPDLGSRGLGKHPELRRMATPRDLGVKRPTRRRWISKARWPCAPRVLALEETVLLLAVSWRAIPDATRSGGPVRRTRCARRSASRVGGSKLLYETLAERWPSCSRSPGLTRH